MNSPQPWFVYILLCEDTSLYTGITTHVQQRFRKHQQGKGGNYTRAHRPVAVVYQEHQPDKSSALKRELEIKSWSRAEKIQRLGLADFIK